MSTIPLGTITEICYVTSDMNKTIEQWATGLKAGPFFKMTIPVDFGVRSYRGKPATDSFSAALGFCGSTLLEFIQPENDAPSVFREVLDTRGDMAMHHIYPNLQPIDAAEFDRMNAAYLKSGYEPAAVMTLPGLGRNVLFDARNQLGVFVELLEVSTAMYTAMGHMLAAHQNWDGERPIRDFMESMS